MTKILVVDDSEVIRVQLNTDLSGAGYDIVQAYDGLNGLEVMAEHKDIALIISDVNMPEMDGLTMCKKLHDNADYKHIPIIMLTTQTNPEMKAISKEHGVIAWVNKPYKVKTLLGGINKILSKTK